MDVDTMKPGFDFAKQLDEQVSKCDVLLAIIGPNWIDATDEKGRRKLGQDGDFVRIELAAALKRDIPVIPLLVHGAVMPSEDELPEELKPLTRRHAMEIRHTRFTADCEAIIRALTDLLPRRRRWPHIVAAVLSAAVLLGSLAWVSAYRQFEVSSGPQQTGKIKYPGQMQPPSSNSNTADTGRLTGLANDPATDTRSSASNIRDARNSSTNSAGGPDSQNTDIQSTSQPKVLSKVLPADRSQGASTASGRVALVIGNGKYPDAEEPLSEPINDARAVADQLRLSRFEIDVGENLNGESMRRALDRFYAKVKPGSAALIFFSGFGVQSNRQSYLIPVDAQIWTESDVRREGFSLETILDTLSTRGAAVKIALIDGARRNPFERRFRSFSAGLAPIIAPSGSIVMYSQALGSVSLPSDYGVFRRELVEQMKTPDLMIEESLNRTRQAVTKATKGEQVPWISSSLAEDFFFNDGVSANAK